MFEKQQQEQLCFIEDETRASFSNVHHLLPLLGERIDLPSFICFVFCYLPAVLLINSLQTIKCKVYPSSFCRNQN